MHLVVHPNSQRHSASAPSDPPKEPKTFWYCILWSTQTAEDILIVLLVVHPNSRRYSDNASSGPPKQPKKKTRNNQAPWWRSSGHMAKRWNTNLETHSLPSFYDLRNPIDLPRINLAGTNFSDLCLGTSCLSHNRIVIIMHAKLVFFSCPIYTN